LHVQIRDLTAEHHLIIDEKDTAIAELRREVDGLKTQNTALSCDLAAESDNRKSAVVCAENLTRQHDIKDKKIVKLEDEVTELESKLVQEKVKSTADKGGKEKLLSMTKKWAEIAKIVADPQ
jgi:ribosomal protein L29